MEIARLTSHPGRARVRKGPDARFIWPQTQPRFAFGVRKSSFAHVTYRFSCRVVDSLPKPGLTARFRRASSRHRRLEP